MSVDVLGVCFNLPIYSLKGGINPANPNYLGHSCFLFLFKQGLISSQFQDHWSNSIQCQKWSFSSGTFYFQLPSQKASWPTSLSNLMQFGEFVWISDLRELKLGTNS